jgi:hypothetical protein
MNNSTADEKELNKQQYIDPKGCWIDPEQKVRRMSDEQQIVLSAAEACSDLNGVTCSTLFGIACQR